MFRSADTAILPNLDPGERLLWSGKPVQGIRLRPADLFLIPFSLLWGGFVIFWETMALTMIPRDAGFIGWLFPLFGLPFVGVGLYVIAGRFVVDARARARTYYGVTNQRVMIVTGGRSTRVRSVVLANVQEITLTEHANGTGNIHFGPEYAMVPAWANQVPRNRFQGPSLEGIDRARDVYAIIRQAQRSTS
jgi:hypothetical protein